MKDDRLTKQIFLWDLTQPGDSWSNDICNIFKSINLESKFDSQTTVDISQMEQLLQSNSEDMWLTELINKPKLRTYILFKNTLITENYVSSYLSRYQRSLIAQLRLGILPLCIETGRLKILKTKKLVYYVKQDQMNVCVLCVIPKILRTKSILFVNVRSMKYIVKNCTIE